MSDVVEKTLSALPSLLSLDSQPGAGKLSSTSKLGSLIRNITELTSKHEEEKLIKRELAALKEQVSSPNTTMKQMREAMVRAIYCEMLGYEASFTYIHAIKLAQQGTVLEKRVGYLAVSLFLNESHDLLLLLVNTVLKDLQSSNLIEVCMALTVVSQVFPKDMIPAILPVVEEKLTHPKEIIRRKAVLALYKFYLIAPNQVQHIHAKFRKALCDKDPGVMTASLHIYLQLIKESPDMYKELTGSFVTILKQVVGGKLPIDFNYHSVPAPWLQIQLLRILGLLGREDQSTSELMYDVLDESLRRAEMNHNITYAILYECVKAIYSIYPKSELCEKAAKCIGNFVLSPKINLKYLGLKALTYVVQQDANLALQHQMTIIECLDHPDLIIKKETLELLFRITNTQNVTVIVEKMLGFLKLSNDDYTIVDLVGKVAELAEKYAPDNEWFIQTMNEVFSFGGDMMQPDIPNSFLRLLAEGCESAEESRQLRLYAVDSYLAVLQKDSAHLPQRFLQIISWVLGEYSHLKEGLDVQEVRQLLMKLLDRKGVTTETRCWVLSSLMKLCEGPGADEMAQELVERWGSSLDPLLRQQAQELLCLSLDKDLRTRTLPLATTWDGLEVDSSLSFLDGFVAEALAAGAAPYKPPHQRQQEQCQEKALSLEPYGLSLPVSLSSCSLTDRQSPTLLSMSSGQSGNSTEPSNKAGSSKLNLEGVKRVWGKEGYLPHREVPEESAPVEEASSAVQSSSQQGGASDKSSMAHTEPVEQDKEKQQLASSLFVGLGSHNATSLMGKSETPSQRFRRKPRTQVSTSSSVTSEKSDSSHSSRSTVDSFLYGSLLEEEPVLPQPNTSHTPRVTTANGSSETKTQSFIPTNGTFEGEEAEEEEEEPTQTENDITSVTAHRTKQGSLIMNSDMVIVQPTMWSDQPKDWSQDDSGDLLSSGSDTHMETSPLLLLPADLRDLPHSNINTLAADQSLLLSSCHVYRDDALVLVIFLSNSGETPIQEIAVQLNCEQLEVASLRGNVIDTLDGLGTSVCRYTLVMDGAHTQVEMTGTVSYQAGPGHTQTLPFSSKLSLADFIRPLVITTEEYGKLWLSFSHDVKQNLKLLKGDRDPLVTTLDALKETLQLHIVDIIGSEGIVACRLLQGAPCLLHCRIHGDSLAVWLRSSLPGLPDCVLYYCQKALLEH
ncbi:AP-4 complex subunit epsilon-1 [Chanos chanos]|uniref:AP-4 complex subunit epsilon-1 n=1 Tax=Chanos chanos TaxID=29144 RepID=A0A6J2VJT6_CHACN|nr:AP-4 complex subunit epsilon-1 [Chanos chanos]